MTQPDRVPGEVPSPARILGLKLTRKGIELTDLSFDQEVVTVGRDGRCDIRVDDRGISRNHFKIVRSHGGEFRITDQGSSNGTYLNDRPVKFATLRDGDVIHFGGYSLTVSIEELVGADEPPPAKPQSNEAPTLIIDAAEMRRRLREQQPSAAPAPTPAPAAKPAPAPPQAKKPAAPPAKPAAAPRKKTKKGA
jgi:pSer/pThr/pTyr-binding forkhead associated (FHA) protein